MQFNKIKSSLFGILCALGKLFNNLLNIFLSHLMRGCIILSRFMLATNWIRGWTPCFHAFGKCSFSYCSAAMPDLNAHYSAFLMNFIYHLFPALDLLLGVNSTRANKAVTTLRTRTAFGNYHSKSSTLGIVFFEQFARHACFTVFAT